MDKQQQSSNIVMVCVIAIIAMIALAAGLDYVQVHEFIDQMLNLTASVSG